MAYTDPGSPPRTAGYGGDGVLHAPRYSSTTALGSRLKRTQTDRRRIGVAKRVFFTVFLCLFMFFFQYNSNDFAINSYVFFFFYPFVPASAYTARRCIRKPPVDNIARQRVFAPRRELLIFLPNAHFFFFFNVLFRFSTRSSSVYFKLTMFNIGLRPAILPPGSGKFSIIKIHSRIRDFKIRKFKGLEFQSSKCSIFMASTTFAGSASNAFMCLYNCNVYDCFLKNTKKIKMKMSVLRV